MKTLGFTLLAVAVLALPICAQPVTAVADVPFAFVAGNATMPAGQYVIRISAGSFAVALVGADGHAHYLNSNVDYAQSSSGGPELVFQRYGDRCFLSEIRTPDKGREIATSRLEREVQKTASAGRASQQIVLAMR